MAQRQPLILVGGQEQQLQAADYANIGIPFFMHKNRILNGDFNIWQRGSSLTAITTSGTYYPDQWVYTFDGTSGNVSVQQMTFTAGQTAVPDNPQNYCECSVSISGSGMTYLAMSQRIEGVQTFQGQTVTLSFWAKADTTRSLGYLVSQNFGSGGSATVTSLNNSVWSLSTSWQQYTVTFSVASISGKTVGNNNYLQIGLLLPINTGFTIDIAHVQLELGQNATQFEYRHVAHELDMCQRYYQQIKTPGAYAVVANGFNYSSIYHRGLLIFSPKRAIPTLTFSAPSTFVVVAPNGNFAVTALLQAGTTPMQAFIQSTCSGLTVGYGAWLHDNNTSATVTISAEL